MTVFDSRDPRYKSPFGAVPCGTAVTLTVTPEEAYSTARLFTSPPSALLAIT